MDEAPDFDEKPRGPTTVLMELDHYWETPKGSRIAVVRFEPSSEPPQPSALALLGRGDDDALSASVARFAASARSRSDRVELGALLFVAIHLGKSGPKWPVRGPDGSFSAATHHRKLAVGLDSHEFNTRILLPLEDDAGRPGVTRNWRPRSSTIKIAIKRQPVPRGDDLRWAFSAARWNVPPTEYGRASDADRRYVQETAVRVVDQMLAARDPQDPGRPTPESEALSLVFGREINRALELTGDDALSRLAALREFFDRGTERLMASAAAFYNDVLHEVTTAATSSDAPAEIAAVLSRGQPLHELLYNRSNIYDRDVFFWLHGPGRDPTIPRLLPPRVVNFADQLLPPGWWTALLRAVDAGDSTQREVCVDQLHRMVALVARVRLVEGTKHAVNPVGDAASVEDLAESLDAAADPLTSQSAEHGPSLLDRLREQATKNPAERGILIAFVRRWHTMKEIAETLGLSIPRVQQLEKSGLSRLRDNPPLAELLIERFGLG